MYQRSLIWVFLGALNIFLLAMACGGGASTTENTRGSLTQTVEGIRVEITLSPNPLGFDTDTTLEIRITGGEGQPVSDARVVTSLNSAAHGMQPSVAAAESKGDGVYVGVLKPLGMTGSHYINVDFDWRGKAYQARFDNLKVK
jgi:hypothetical protein